VDPVYTGMSCRSIRKRLRAHKTDKAFTHFEYRQARGKDARRTEKCTHRRGRKLVEKRDLIKTQASCFSRPSRREDDEAFASWL